MLVGAYAYYACWRGGGEMRAKPEPRARSAREMRAKPESRAEPEIEWGTK